MMKPKASQESKTQPEFEKALKKITELPNTLQQVHLAALLSDLFDKENVSLSIVGGASVQFYTQAEYTTKDLDAILIGDTTERIERVMGKLGFRRTTTYRHFEHPSFPFVVEFPPEPVQVGGRYISSFVHLETEFGPVRIIRIEDIIMDRIIAGVEWEQEHYLDQARLLWIKNKERIDRKYLTQFAKEEGYEKTLRDIMNYKE